ncbi:cytochrome P450 2B5-like [Littorina saxatilis]|uniref:cytochrome P450 2B5-like n=1 Tax=Littorina saxatilis TaxID=31220 RepID=UPI0038B52373
MCFQAPVRVGRRDAVFGEPCCIVWCMQYCVVGSGVECCLFHLIVLFSRKKFSEWREKYGDVFSFYRGGQLVVVLNGYQAIRDALVKHGQDFSGRPHSFLVDRVCQGMGLSGSSGNDNKEQRKVSTEILSHLGMGHSYQQVQIMEEVMHYLQAIEDLKGEATDLLELTHVSISNNICSIVFGKRYDYHDPLFLTCMLAIKQNFYDIYHLENFSFVPFKEYMPFDPFNCKEMQKK